MSQGPGRGRAGQNGLLNSQVRSLPHPVIGPPTTAAPDPAQPIASCLENRRGSSWDARFGTLVDFAIEPDGR